MTFGSFLKPAIEFFFTASLFSDDTQFLLSTDEALDIGDRGSFRDLGTFEDLANGWHAQTALISNFDQCNMIVQV